MSVPLFLQTMRVVSLLVLVSLTAAARTGVQQMGEKLKPEPETEPETAEVAEPEEELGPPLQRQDAFNSLPEMEYDAAATIPEDVKLADPALVQHFEYQPCCSCGLNWGSVAPKMTKFFFKLHKTCDRIGGSPTWTVSKDLTFCGLNCEANRKGKVCWKREYVKGGTRKLRPETQDRSSGMFWQ